MKGDSSLLEPDQSWLAGDEELMHDQVTKTSTPKRHDAAYDADESSALLNTIEVTSITLGSDTLSSATDNTFADTTGVEDITDDYDGSQAREELSESIHSVRNTLPMG